MSAQLDAKGLSCPLPVLKAKKALKKLDSGDVLTIEATDPSSVKDFQTFCEATGDRLLEQRESDGIFVHLIEKQ